ncbi:ABC transporter substrate-binding protein [Corynebacterium pseudotuberculosis]|uniref:ABC transporter substrate-binding protein n=1 Tax=Corynebacterium pseudotuberculosis (strain C231) TaxID=681645 RepID=D9QCY9_CORP2|nr:ABC transporter substrate-binding protein [Corynebacterium pseudotuberculosis]ADK29766.1 ABC transporter substrate-binding protein [Corynebacterium pseudotuberculosis FRC41]ADL11415.1 ABC transporter substrate-binding protein [Corynebacterium pseudotuberculosis C231]ADL21827.1 ABC transporter substrate-binding protein [Corynebacterium pseudotuberculosis 1002]ADO27225.1 ABC transporter substrate-binding protein [Corynebacterium pseudotuberculosis I19]AEK93284.1 ABC transporter substrate-bind
MMSRKKSLARAVGSALCGIAIAAAVLVGCSSGEGETASNSAKNADTTQNFPVTVKSGVSGEGESITLEQKPERIVSLSPTATEVLYAIGAGEHVVAVDKHSNYPAGTPIVDGLSGFKPNLEAVVAHDPDLVVVSREDDTFVAGLHTAKIPVLVLPAAKKLDDVYSQIERLGAATGHIADATLRVSEMQSDIESAVKTVPESIKDAHLSYYHEISSKLYAAADSSFIGQVYALFGMRSIASGAKDYPQLTNEAVIDANPDVIFQANHGSEKITPQDLAARPGWNTINAVRTGAIVQLDQDLAARWGTRLPLLIKQVAEQLAALPHDATAQGSAASVAR